MTLPFSANAKPAAVFAALALTALTFGGVTTPSPAAAGEGAFYRAELAAPAAKASPIVAGMVWKCSDTACAAGKGTSRPAIVCARLAREVGQVSAFSAGGKALEAKDLARCNGN